MVVAKGSSGEQETLKHKARKYYHYCDDAGSCSEGSEVVMK